MFKYLNKFEIFYQHQYGFRPQHNTNQPLLHLMNKIYENLNKPQPEFTLGIFLDLKKAFSIQCLYKWYFFKEKTILCGVPQGSVLSTYFFSYT